MTFPTPNNFPVWNSGLWNICKKISAESDQLSYLYTFNHFLKAFNHIWLLGKWYDTSEPGPFENKLGCISIYDGKEIVSQYIVYETNLN